MPANPIAVDVVVLPTVPIGVTIADTTIVIATTVNLGSTVAVDAIGYAGGPPGIGVPPGGTGGMYLVKDSATDYDTSWALAGGGPPSGNITANDLAGSTYPNPTISKIAGAAVGTTTPLARGDLLVAMNVTPVLSRLAKGTPGHVLTAGASDVSWAAPTGGLPSGTVPAGDLATAGSAYPSPVIAPLAVTNAKINDVAWTKITGTASAIRGTPSAGGTAREIAKISIWAADDLIDLSISTAKLAALAVTDAKIADVAWSKITGTASAVRGTPSSGGTAREIAKLSIWGNEDLINASVGDAKLIDMAATKLTGTIAAARFPLAPSGLATNNINDAQVTDAKIDTMTATKLIGTIAAARFPTAPSGLATTNINDATITAAKFSPQPTGSDVGKVLTIAAGPVISWVTPAPGGGAMSGNAVPTGTRPGTVFTLSMTPTMMIASLNGLVLQKVTTPAANDEYSQTGASMTTFYTVTAADKLVVWLWA